MRWNVGVAISHEFARLPSTKLLSVTTGFEDLQTRLHYSENINIM